MMNKRELYYQFDLNIERVFLLINMRCEVQVWWKSGKDKITTLNNIKLLGTQKYFNVNQKLGVTAKVTEQDGKLKQKKTEVLIILFTGDNKSKLGGRVYLNLNQYVGENGNQYQKGGSKKVQCRLANCPDENSRIIFNLSWKYIRTHDNLMSSQSQSLHDISFQANNFSSNMTFRPKEENIDERKNRINSRSKDKDFQKRQFQSSAYNNNRNYNEKQSNRETHKQSSYRGQKSQKPMEFSFNPSQSQREKLGIDNTQLVRDLKALVQQKNQQIRSLKDNIDKLKLRDQMRQAQKQKISSSKSLAMMNQLNATVSEKQDLQRQLTQINKLYSQLKQQTRRMQSELMTAKSENKQISEHIRSQQQHQKHYISQLQRKLEQYQKKLPKLQDQVFRKQSQLIDKDTQIQKYKYMHQSSTKQSTEQLKNISNALQQLKIQYKKTYQQKQQQKLKNQALQHKLQENQAQNRVLSHKLQQVQEHMLRQRDQSKKNYSLLQLKFQQRQNIIKQIEQQFQKLNHEKVAGSQEKDQQINHLRQKFNASCRKIDQLAQRQQSYRNQISTLNIRIKSMEDICSQNQKSEKILEQKEQLLEKAKQYIKVKQQQIEKRDQFINRAKLYIEGKQKQIQSLKSQTTHNNNTTNQNHQQQIIRYQEELKNIRYALSQKQRDNFNIIQEKQRLLRQIEQMENYIDSLKEKIMDLQDTIDQMHRKIEHQEETLKDLVKKNLDMEIQINVKNFQLQALKDNR